MSTHKRDPEMAYWYHSVPGQIVNLSHAIRGAFMIRHVYGLPDPPHSAALDALDSLRRRHPQARTEPPFYQVAFSLEGTWQIRPYDEITLWLPNGFYIGFVDRVDHLSAWYEGRTRVGLLEAGYCFLNGWQVPT